MGEPTPTPNDDITADLVAFLRDLDAHHERHSRAFEWDHVAVAEHDALMARKHELLDRIRAADMAAGT